jgi:hypothetical protein
LENSGSDVQHCDGVLNFFGRTKGLPVVSSMLPTKLGIRILNLIALMCLFDAQGYPALTLRIVIIELSSGTVRLHRSCTGFIQGLIKIAGAN